MENDFLRWMFMLRLYFYFFFVLFWQGVSNKISLIVKKDLNGNKQISTTTHSLKLIEYNTVKVKLNLDFSEILFTP